MLSVSYSVKVSIPNLDSLAFEIKCPICRLHTWTDFGEARRDDYVICRGCHANIKFEDHLGGLYRTKEIFEETLKGMER
ncbi:MAG: hypothetical protein ABSE93_28350 [Terriglobia bacterium]|jgi:hypothetical protein